MQVIRTTVRNGRIVVDEPTTLPDGHEVELYVLPGGETIEDERTHEVIARGDQELAPGSQLGKYLILRKVATGGMGEIYLAKMDLEP